MINNRVILTVLKWATLAVLKVSAIFLIDEKQLFAWKSVEQSYIIIFFWIFLVAVLNQNIY